MGGVFTSGIGQTLGSREYHVFHIQKHMIRQVGPMIRRPSVQVRPPLPKRQQTPGSWSYGPLVLWACSLGALSGTATRFRASRSQTEAWAGCRPANTPRE